MSLHIRIFLTSLLTLLIAALLAIAPVAAKPASGGYQLFEPVALADQHAIQLATLENFDYFAKIAPECCNAPKGTLDDLAKFRQELGLPPAGSAADKSTLAVVEVNGQKSSV